MGQQRETTTVRKEERPYIKPVKMTTACVKLEFRLFTTPGDGEKTDKLPVQVGFALYLKSQ